MQNSRSCWHHSIKSGPPGIPFSKTQNSPPRQRKNSRKFPFGKILHSAHPSTQFSDIYWCNYSHRSVCKTLHVTVIILIKSLEIRILLSPIETDQQRPGKVVSGQNSPTPPKENAKCAECNFRYYNRLVRQCLYYYWIRRICYITNWKRNCCVSTRNVVSWACMLPNSSTVIEPYLSFRAKSRNVVFCMS